MNMDTRVGIAWLLAYSVALFLADSLAGQGLLALALAAVVARGSLDGGKIVREAVASYPLVAFLAIYNVAAAGWQTGAVVALRVLLLVYGGLALMQAFTASGLSLALRQLLTPLGRLGLPVRDVEAALSIAVRFMPLMAGELKAVRAAQASRGAPFTSGSPWHRLRAAAGVMVPTFVGLFRRADRLALAMDARCFGASDRPTSLAGRPMGRRDWAALGVGVLLCFLPPLVS